MTVTLAVQTLTAEGFGTLTLRMADADELARRWYAEDQAALWAEFTLRSLTEDEVMRIADASLTLAEMGV